MRSWTTSCCSGILAALALGGLGACDPAAEDPGDAAPSCDSPGETVVGVLSVIEWGRADDDGVSMGFDLDGRQSTGNDPQGCYVADYLSPDGESGIDNGFTRLLPALEMTEAVAVEGLIAQSIASGELLISIELTGVDDRENDACVGLKVGRATGDVLLGTDGKLESGQTLERDLTRDTVSFENLSIVDGRVIARPFNWSLPIQVFDVSLDFALNDGGIQIDLDPEGGMHGVVGGAVSVAYIEEIAGGEGVDDDLLGLMSALLNSYADLQPDENGECQSISVNLEYDAIDAFLFED